MRKFLMLSVPVLILLFMVGQAGYSQGVLKKIKEKAEDRIVDEIFGKDESDDSNTNTNQDQSGTYDQGTSSSGTSSRMGNQAGGGLSNTTPDVKKNIDDAESSYKNKEFSEARYSVRQALLGIELEMGKKVLEGLPSSVKGIDKVAEEDKVTSASIGFIGLMIERVYRNDEKEVRFTVGNDAALLSPVSMYLSGAYVASTDEPNQKQVKFKGYPAVIEYDENSGYKLSVPFGQSSIMIVEGVNIASEEEMMSTAEEFDIEKIKKELGEQ